MILSFEGPQGNGKTTLATAMVYEDWFDYGVRVVSNNHLFFPETQGLPEPEHFSLEWWMEHLSGHELEDCDLLLDEFFQLMDSRSSSSKLNKVFSYFVAQARKRGVDLYICTHHIDHIDKRTQRAIDLRGSVRNHKDTCRRHKEEHCIKCHGTGLHNGEPCERCRGYGVYEVIEGLFLDRRRKKRYILPIVGNDYWHLFSTKERIPIQAKILRGIDTAEIMP